MKRRLASFFGAYGQHPIPAIVMLVVIAAAVIVGGATYVIRHAGPGIAPAPTTGQPVPPATTSRYAPLPSSMSPYTGPVSPPLQYDPFGSSGDTPRASLTAGTTRPPTETSSAAPSVSPSATVSVSATPDASAEPTPTPDPDPTPQYEGSS